MQVDVALCPDEVKYIDLSGKLAVVIDVFRFTTTAVTALQNGAKSVSIVREVAQAEEYGKRFGADILRAGERDAKIIPGFELGNSPLDFRPETVSGKMIVSTTTNGTKAVTSCQNAKSIVLACLRNANAVANHLQKLDMDVVFVPAGLYDRFSLEDTWCAGYIAHQLGGSFSDSAIAARAITRNLPISALRSSEHGRKLVSLGLSADLDYCLTLNADDTVVEVDPESLIAEVCEEKGKF